MTTKQMLAAVGLETPASARLPVPQAVDDNAFRLRDDERAIILAAVGPDEKCFCCGKPLTAYPVFHNALCVDPKAPGKVARHWICAGCGLAHTIELGHTFPSTTKMIRLLKVEVA